MSKFFNKFKGEKQDYSHLNSDSSSSNFASNNPYRNTQSQPPAYQPPPGPPPSHQPQKPPAAVEDDTPPPYHDWTSVPDNSLLPPPPPLASDYSSATNASYDDAAAAHAWCATHPVFTPTVANTSVIENVISGRNGLAYPPGVNQRGWILTPTTSTSSNALGATPTGTYQILSPSNPTASSSNTSTQPRSSSNSRFLRSAPNSRAPAPNPPTDACWTSTLPLFFAATSNPLSPHFASPKPHPYTVYFELTPLHYYAEESTVAIGFVSKPYPLNRQPGWHRASIGVHSDDGNRYVNDSWGGRPFTDPFRKGESIGLGVVFSPQQPTTAFNSNSNSNSKTHKSLQSDREVRSPLPKCTTRIYLTRNGNVTGSWDIDEERDAEKDEGVAGLMGEADLYAAVGTFGDVDVEVRFFAGGEGVVPPPA